MMRSDGLGKLSLPPELFVFLLTSDTAEVAFPAFFLPVPLDVAVFQLIELHENFELFAG